MCEITNFYEYKYCRKKYIINIFINKETAQGIRVLLAEKIKDKKISRDYKYAYKNLKDKIDKNINDDIYVKLRLNKCYLQYLKDLYYDFYDREESIYVKELIFHIQYFINRSKVNWFRKEEV